MDLKDIMSVSGQSGLFKFVSQGRNGIIVESFADNKRIFVNATQKVSSLADIAIFTEGEEVPLKDVFKKIHEAPPDTKVPDPKSEPADLKKFMEIILPEYDRNRVYVSDIKKLVSWYNILLSLNLLTFDEEVQAATESETGTEVIADSAKHEETKDPQPQKPLAEKKPSKSKKAPKK